MKHLTRSVMALAIVLASTSVCPEPASAAVFSGTTATSGTLVLSKAGSPDATFGLDGTAIDCPAPSYQVYVDPTSGPTASVNITAMTKYSPGATYVAIITRVGGVTGSSTSTVFDLVTGLGLSISSTVHRIVAGTNCQLGARVCGFSSALTLSGTHSGFAIGTGSTMALAAPAAGLTVLPPCAAPWTAYAGGTASITGLGLSLA